MYPSPSEANGLSVSPGMRATIRRLPRSAWLLFVGHFIIVFGQFVPFFLVLYLTHKGYPPAQAGLAIAAMGVGGIPAAALGGYLSDRVGRRETLAAGALLSAGLTMVLAFASGLQMIVGLSFLVSVCGGIGHPAIGALLSDLVPPSERVVAVGVMRWFGNAGLSAGPVVAGFLADRSFLLGFILDAGTAATFGILAILFLPHGAPRFDHKRVRAEGIRAIASDRRFALFLVASVLCAAVYTQVNVTLPLWVHANGFDNAAYGFLVSLNAVVIIATELLVIALTRRWPVRPTIAVGIGIIGIGFGLTAAAHTIPVLALTVLVWTVGEMMWTPMSQTYVYNMAPPHLRGRYSAAYGLTWSLALILGSITGASVFALNPAAVWLVCAAVCAVSATMVVVSGWRAAEVRPGAVLGVPTALDL